MGHPVTRWLNRPLFAMAISVGFCLMAVALCGGYWLRLMAEQDAARAEAKQQIERDAGQLAQAAAVQVDSILRSVDVTLLNLREDYIENRPQFIAAVRRTMTSFPDAMVQFVSVADARGQLVYSSLGGFKPVNVSDRDYFKAHAEGGSDRAFIGKPIIGRLTGVPLIVVSRPLYQQGKFTGVITIPLRWDYLIQSLSFLINTNSNMIALARDDGSYIFNSTTGEAEMPPDAPADSPFLHAAEGAHGLWQGAASSKGRPLLLGWQKLQHWPLSAIAGLNTEERLAPLLAAQAESRNRADLAIAAVIVLSLGISTLLLMVALRNQRLAAEERRLRQLFDSNVAVKLVVDPSDGRIVNANQAACSYYGYRREQLLQLNIGDINCLSPEALAAEMNLARTEKRSYFRFRHRLASGDIRDVEVYSGPMDTPEGPRLFSIVHDVTERLQAEAQLREAEAFKSGILNGAAYAIIGTDPDGLINLFNPGAERLLGFRTEEMIGHCTPAVFHDPEEVRRRAIELSEELGQPVEPGFEAFVIKSRVMQVPDEREWTYVRRDGKRIAVWLAVTTLRNQEGRVTGYLGIAEDISARKQVETDLRTILDSLPAMVGYWDRDLRNRFGNHAYSDWFGVSPESMKGLHIRALLGEQLFALNLPHIEAALRGEPQIFERAIPTPSLGLRHSLAQYIPDIQNGKVQGFYVMVSDITGIREAEAAAAAAASEQRYRNALESAQMGTFVHDFASGVLRFDQRAQAHHGLDSRTISVDRLTALIHPDDRERVAQIRERLLNPTQPDGRDQRFEIRVIHPSGEIRHLEISAQLRFEDTGAGSRPISVTGTTRDITDRVTVKMALEESRIRYQELIQRIPVGVYTFRIRADRSMVFEFVSPRFCQLLKLDEATVLADAGVVFAAAHPDDLAALVAAQDEHAASLAPFRWEGRFMIAGEQRWLRIESDGTPQANGDSVWNGVMRDVTEQHLADAALRAARDAAEAANQAKSQFLATMSHEIRTPMNAILGLTGFVLESELSPQQRDYLSKVQSSSQALLGILNDVLDYAKIEAERLEIAALPFSPGDTLREVAALFAARAEEKGLTLRVDLAPEVPAQVSGDAVRVTQVLNNLLGNAIKFSAQGEIHLLAYLAEGDATGLTLGFSVQDHGIGMSAAQTARLFQPFTQADGSITRKYGGTGLGLAICNRLVQLMGGRIAVSSEEGQGSTFTFTVQVANHTANTTAGSLPLQAGRSNMAQLQAQARPINGARVLLAEDHPVNQEVAAELLRKLGLQVSVANNGAEALALVEAKEFDAVLMDLHMPQMDGLEATRRIRALAHRPLPPVIAMTAAVMQEDRERCTAAGMGGFVAKPIEPQQLLDALLACIAPRTAAAPQASAMPSITARLPRLPGFDLEGALARVGGDAELLRRLLLGFADEQARNHELLDALTTVGERQQAGLLLHTIKGVAGNLGCNRLAQTASAYQQALANAASDDTGAALAFAEASRHSAQLIQQHLAAPSGNGATPVNGGHRELLAQLLPYLGEGELLPDNLLGELRAQAAASIDLQRLLRLIDRFDHPQALSLARQLAGDPHSES